MAGYYFAMSLALVAAALLPWAVPESETGQLIRIIILFIWAILLVLVPSLLIRRLLFIFCCLYACNTVVYMF